MAKAMKDLSLVTCHLSPRCEPTPPTPSRWGSIRFSEVLTLIVSFVLVTALGASVHRQMWEAAGLLGYRSVMQELASAVRAMPSRAIAERRTIQLHADAAHGVFQLTVVVGRPMRYETIERTIWLPKGLEISEAPPVVSASPAGRLSRSSIVVAAPSYNRMFRLTTNEQGLVQLHEESTL